MNTVCITQQGDKQIAKRNCIGNCVDILKEVRGNRPVVDPHRRLRLFSILIPDVPFVKRDEYIVFALQLGLSRIDDGSHILDEAIHIVA